MSMMLRRQMMIPKAGGGGLPAEYQQVAYLESSGTQYITTETVPKITSNADSLYVDFSILTSNTVIVFGVGGTGFQLPSIKSYHIRGDMVANKYFGYTSYGEKCSFKIENQTATCLGESYEGVYNNYSNPLILFGKGSYELSTLLIGRIYYCSYTYNNVKQAELIPCYRKADNEPGMYDTVSGTFYTNAGTGEFVVGPDVTPEGYIKSGLVLFLDGLNRGGVSGEWHDLIDPENIVTLTNATEQTDGVYFENGSTATQYGVFSKQVAVSKDVGTIESATTLTAIESTGRTIMSMQNNNSMGGTVASSGTEGFPVGRYYVSSSNVYAYKFETITGGFEKLIMSLNDDRGYCNGQVGTKYNIGAIFSPGTGYYLARKGNNSNAFKGTIHAIRLYNRKLTAEEILHNQRIDNARFNLGLTI